MKSRFFAGIVIMLLFLGVWVIVGCEQADNPAMNSESESISAAPSFPQEIRLNVPFLAQVPPGDWPNTKNCGQASLVNCAAYLWRICPTSIYITYANQWLAVIYNDKRFLDPNGYTASIDQLANLARSYFGFCNSKSAHPTLQDLYNELKVGRPVVVLVRVDMDTTKIGHFMALVGMSSSYVWLNDVGKTNGKDKCFSMGQFESSWKSNNNACVFVRM